MVRFNQTSGIDNWLDFHVFLGMLVGCKLVQYSILIVVRDRGMFPNQCLPSMVTTQSVELGTQFLTVSWEGERARPLSFCLLHPQLPVRAVRCIRLSHAASNLCWGEYGVWTSCYISTVAFSVPGIFCGQALCSPFHQWGRHVCKVNFWHACAVC